MTANAGDVAYPDLQHQVRVFDQIHARLASQPWDWTDDDHNIITKTAVWIPVTNELFHDLGYRMWELPDRNPMPHIVLFPRLAHATTRARIARQRIRDAIGVLRHGLPELEERDAW